MIDYDTAIRILEAAFDSVRRGDDGPHLAANTAMAFGYEPTDTPR
jgi:hypothetical protein